MLELVGEQEEEEVDYKSSEEGPGEGQPASSGTRRSRSAKQNAD